MRLLRNSGRAMLGIVTAAALTSSALVAPAEAATKTHPRAVAASSWLSGELDRQLPFQQYGFPSWGPTLDAYFAFDALDERAGKRSLILETLEDDVESYVNMGGDVAGAIAKTLAAVQAGGRDIDTYAGGGLLERLEAQVETSGAEEGRVHEYYDDGSTVTDYSNTLDQGWTVRALAGADSEHEDRALQFLLKQQCEDGWFRESLSAEAACSGTPSIDSTAFAVLTIADAARSGVDVASPLLTDSMAAAGRWLASVQRSDGGFAGYAGASSDSTGLAAQALLALGRAQRADAAAEWLQRHQVTAAMARRTALRTRDVGSLAPTTAALRAAKRHGVPAESRINWQLASAQGAPGLDALIPG